MILNNNNFGNDIILDQNKTYSINNNTLRQIINTNKKKFISHKEEIKP